MFGAMVFDSTHWSHALGRMAVDGVATQEGVWDSFGWLV